MRKGKSPKKFTPEFKLSVVFESYASGNASSTAARNGVHMTQINNWKKQLLRHGSMVFQSKITGKTEEQHKIEQLEKALGLMAFENDILKKTEALLNSGR